MPLLADTGLGIPVWSAARQGFTYQFTYVGWLRLLRVSSFLTHHQSPSAAPISFKKNPIQYVKHFVTPYTPREQEGMARFAAFQTYGNGYFHMQSTRPQTLGYSLADSPVGMLAWIYDKLVQGTDNYPWTDEEGACLALSITVFSHSALTVISIDLDINLLVLACGANSIAEDLLRDRLPRLPPRTSSCACWHIFLS